MLLSALALAAVPLGAAAAQPHANIFMLLTDDQDVTLGGLDGHAHGIPYKPGPNPMPQLKKYLTEQGTTFSNAFVHTPICCPSRSSYMTGRYLHNSGTFENDIGHGCSNQTWADGPETRSFAAHAKAAGYHTSYSGKYLNQYAMPVVYMPGRSRVAVRGVRCERLGAPPGDPALVGI